MGADHGQRDKNVDPDLLVVGRLDVLLHHDDVLVAIPSGAVAPERRRNLLWLPR